MSDNGMSEEREESSLSIRIDTLQNDCDTAMAHLALEKEKVSSLPFLFDFAFGWLTLR